MMRLNRPSYSFKQAIEHCMDGITGNPELRGKVAANALSITNEEARYLAAATAGELFSINPIETIKGKDPDIIKNLKKSDLIKIYDQYFVPEDKPARKIYEALLNSAEEQCPFCGGIGTPRNLDHFLPKAHFPQFSVLPRNLVPACRDCNMDGKSHTFARAAEDQIIQPYLDNDRFFQEQWIFATYHAEPHGEPGEFEYFVTPPKEWSEIDKKRAQKHFNDFSLAKRYSTKAASLVGTTLKQINNLKAVGLDAKEICSSILQPGIDEAPFINHWQRGMYQALMHTLH